MGALVFVLLVAFVLFLVSQGMGLFCSSRAAGAFDWAKVIALVPSAGFVILLWARFSDYSKETDVRGTCGEFAGVCLVLAVSALLNLAACAFLARLEASQRVPNPGLNPHDD